MEYKLRNVDLDDISLDVIPAIEKSFGLKFKDRQLAGVKTFGDFCDAVSAKVVAKDVNDCTTQQSFYRVRQAVASATNIDAKRLTPGARLNDIPIKGATETGCKNRTGPWVSVENASS